jgi:gluconolactonase
MKRLLPLFLLSPLVSLAVDYPEGGTIDRLDPALDALIPKDAKVERLCEGITWAEGPVWKDGALLFSDVPGNIVYRWTPGETKAVEFLNPSGGSSERKGFREPGSNGLALDNEGRLVLTQDATRRIARMEKNGSFTVLADKFEGKHFNSPNDLAIRKNGDIYFTDPPYGLDGLNESPLKELPYNGVFRIAADGKVTLLVKDLTFPNGIAFSPDEKVLYVGVTDPKEPRIYAYDVQADGSVANQRIFFDAVPLINAGLKGGCDGMKVDVHGNIFTSGPGGFVILSPEGKRIGGIHNGQAIANCNWGDDGSTLYMAANHTVIRVKTTTKGATFH